MFSIANQGLPRGPADGTLTSGGTPLGGCPMTSAANKTGDRRGVVGLALVALLLAGLLLLAACGDDDEDTPTPTSPSAADTPTATSEPTPTVTDPLPPPSDPPVTEVSVGIGTGRVSFRC